MQDIIIILKFLFLGLLQGFTEPIPISSSGHLILAQYFLGIEIEGFSLEIFVNTASLFAVLFIYRKDIITLVSNFIRFTFTKEAQYKSDFRFIIYLVIATIPVGISGLLFEDQISSLFNNLVKITGVTLIITGLSLWFIRNLRGRKKDGDLKLLDAVVVGVAQIFALLPGISRSGATIVAAMGMGMKQDTALRFSFLLYIPVSLGGLVFSLKIISNDPNFTSLFIPYLVSFLAALIASYFSLKWFMNIMAKGNLIYFAVYCFVIGTLVLIFA